MNTAFANLDKTKIPFGLLQDYAFELADLGSYAGTLTDSNYVNNEILHNLYTTVCFADIYPANAGSFYHPNYLDSIWMLQRQPGIITLSGIYYNYSSLKSNAVSSGLVTISNNQITDRYINGVWQNPYQTNTVFAMSPPLHSYTGRSFQIILPSNLFFTNNASAVSSFSIDDGDGTGYHTLLKDQLLNVSYADTGNVVWKFCLTLSNGTNLYSQTQMHVLPEPNGPYAGPSNNAFLFKNRSGGAASVSNFNRLFHLYGYPSNPQPQKITASQAYLGQNGWGWVTVSYANTDQKMRNPLIVVEGFDPGYLIDPELPQGFTNFYSFYQSIYPYGSNGNGSPDLFNLLQNPSSQQYDVIYVDWGAGADYMQRNGLLL